MEKKSFSKVHAGLTLSVIFIIDLNVPLGVAVGLLYVISITFLVGIGKRDIIRFSIFATFLIILVPVITYNDSTNWMFFLNRVISVLTIWVVASIIIKQKIFSKLKSYSEELEQKNLEATEQKNMLYALIDNIPLYIGIYDKNGFYTMVNKNYEGVFDLTREEIIGKRLEDVISKKNMKAYGPMLEKALNGEEVEFYRKTDLQDGNQIIANGKYVPVFGEDGEVSFVTITLHDVTKLENIRKELEVANKSKNRLLSIISHDIRGPLGNFSALLEMSGNQIIEKKKFIEFTNDLKIQFAPIQRMVYNLLEWSRMQLKEIVPRPSQIIVKDILIEILKELEPNINKKNIQIETNGSLELLYADMDHFRIIIRNLIGNAVKFTTNDGAISIAYNRLDNFGVIEISDSGVGMSEPLIQDILNEKIVESSQGTMGEKGIGLGLNACLELIKMNLGTIQIESKLDQGTKFIIKLPIVKA